MSLVFFECDTNLFLEYTNYNPKFYGKVISTINRGELSIEMMISKSNYQDVSFIDYKVELNLEDS